MIGTYDYGWPPLAPATVTDRIAKGFTPDDPLLRTGELRDSIQTEVVIPGKLVEIFSDDPVAPFMEFGTSTIPPRSFPLGAYLAKEDEIAELVGDRMLTVWRTGRAP